VTAEIVLALAYLRKMEIIHRDLKPGNIVLDSSHHIKLIDFATCKVHNKDIQAKIAAFKNKNDLLRSMGFHDDTDITMTSSDQSRMNSLVGTEEYLAPETLSDMGELSYSCDYWSLGIIIYQLLNGSTPFKGRSDLETYHNIQKCHEIKFTNSKIDPLAKDLIQGLLVKEPTLRLGYENIEEIMNHPYFEGVDWETVCSSRVPYNPPQARRPVRLTKNAMSSSFSNANSNIKSPLISMSPSASQASSPNNKQQN